MSSTKDKLRLIAGNFTENRKPDGKGGFTNKQYQTFVIANSCPFSGRKLYEDETKKSNEEPDAPKG